MSTSMEWLNFVINWLDKRGEGTGAFIGAAVGLLAIIVGALYNARLERKRDKRIRDSEMKSLAAAILGEVVALNRIAILRDYLGYFKSFLTNLQAGHDVGLPSIHIRMRYTLVYEANVSKIGTLPADIAIKLSEFYSALNSVIEDITRMSGGDMDDSPVGDKARFLGQTVVVLEYLLETGKSEIVPELAKLAAVPIPDLEDGLVRVRDRMPE